MNPLDLQKIASKLPLSPTTVRLNSGAAAAGVSSFQPQPTAPDCTPLPTTREERLNKTEKARLAYLRALGVPSLRIQAITLLVAEDCRYTADFTYLDPDGRMVFNDVKGKHTWEDSLIKIRNCAREFTEFRFIITHRDGCAWIETEIKP